MPDLSPPNLTVGADMMSPLTLFLSADIVVKTVMVGLLAEMLSRTYHESQDKSIYAVRERVGFGDGQ